jgi:hypothetical protein
MKTSKPVIICALGALAILCSPVRATVIINEIMYHPASVYEKREFLELYNTGTTAVDLSAWCIDGISFCLPSGASIPAGGFVVLAADAAQFQTAYGFVADYAYSGQLSNQGERLRLLDAGGMVVDEVEYAEKGDWPPSADGQGPSLERIVPTMDGNTPRNWHSCKAGAKHTARATNSVCATVLPPWISEVSYSTDLQPQESLLVTARAEGADSVSLIYVIEFGTETSIPMMDDGASGDGSVDDGVFGATIPGQIAGTMIRFKLVATGPSGQMRYPRDDDTIYYVGTLVADPSLSSQQPIFDWRIDPARYQAALDHRSTDQMEPAVLFYNGKLYDNIQIRIRGQTSRSWPKPNWKFKFQQGHDFYDPSLILLPADNFDLQSHYSDKAFCREILSHESFRAAGVPASQAFHVRVQKNGQFFGLFTYLEDLDEDLLARYGLNEDGARYKAYDDARDRGSEAALHSLYEKESRQDEDYADLYALLHGINNLTGQARTDFIFDNIDIPGMVNYLAATLIIHNNDHPAKNYTLYRDTLGTQRWTMFPSDLDLTFGRNFGPGGGVLSDGIWADNDNVGRTSVSPSHPLFGDRYHEKYDFLWNRIIDALLADSRFCEMHYRRTRTLADELLAAGRYEARIAELDARIATEAEMDRNAWGQYGTAQTLAEATELIVNSYLPRRRQHLLVTHQAAGEIPAAQSPQPSVIINEIMYRPAGDTTAEFVELYNPSPDEAVDLSGWRLLGVGLTLPGGTVILPQDYVVVVRDDVQFRSVHSGILVVAQYEGQLDRQGEELKLVDRSGRVVDIVHYANETPWPTAADGGGPSLELIDSAQDNDRPANWAASQVAGGTPGASNSATGSTPSLPPLWVNEVLPQNTSINTDENGEYAPWIEIYNSSNEPVELGGMHLTDDYAEPTKWTIPADTTIGGHGWLLIWADGEAGEGALHTSFELNSLGGSVGLFTAGGVIVDYLNYDPLLANISCGKIPDGISVQREFSRPTPSAANQADTVPLILNEYNAVRSGGYLKDEGRDVYWGRVADNGGCWFELVATGDHLDMRGWVLKWDQLLTAPEQHGTITLSSHTLWSNLRSGTIITITESPTSAGGLDTETSFNPSAGDWWININTLNPAPGAGNLYVASTTSDVPGDGQGQFSVGNSNWQLTILDAEGRVVFGPAGEGINPLSGVGNDEVFKLEEDPSPCIHPFSNYNDGTSSTFGAPNRWSSGTLEQSFAALRAWFEPCQTAGDCDDANLCTIDACDPFQGCVHTLLPNGTSCDNWSFCDGAETCQEGFCTAGAPPCVDQAHCSEVDDGRCLSCLSDAECDDTQSCTNDTCVNGDCDHAVESGFCGIGGSCYENGDANPINPCQVCDAEANPTAWTSLADGTSCDDTAFCNGTEACQAGQCVAGAAPCLSGQQCDEVEDRCTGLPENALVLAVVDAPQTRMQGEMVTIELQAANLTVAVTAVQANIGFNPSQLAFVSFQAASLEWITPNPVEETGMVFLGAAHAGSPLSPGGSYVVGALTFRVLQVGNDAVVSLLSGDPPDFTAFTDQYGAFFPPTQMIGTRMNDIVITACSDGNACTDESFDGTICVFVNNTAPCDDGSACTTNDTCLDGACVGGPPPNCDDGNVCTDDSCNPSTGCVHTDNTAPCSDGSACTTNDRCVSGSCVSGAPADCDDHNDCTDDTCEPLVGCAHVAYADATPCSDGQYCNGADACYGGVCVAGSTSPCDAVCEQCSETADTCEHCMFDLSEDGYGVIGGNDFSVFAGAYGACYPAGDPHLRSNFDGSADGCVGGGDFSVFSGCYAKTCGACTNCFGARAEGRDGTADDGYAAIALVAVARPTPLDVVATLPTGVTSFPAGQTFYVEVWASGGRWADGLEEGLASAYVDVHYDPQVLIADSAGAGMQFGLFALEMIDSRIGVVKVGGCAALGESTLGTGQTWVRVGTLSMHGVLPVKPLQAASGPVVKTGPAAAPYGISIFNRFGDLSAEQIKFGSVPVRIRPR